MSDEQSDHDEVIARANKHIDARLHDMEIGGRVGDSAEGGLAMEFGYYRDSCQMFYINGRDDMKAVMQPEIDTLRTEVAYYDSALRKIRELTKGVIYSADSKFADIAEIANAARGGIVSKPPENLKALRTRVCLEIADIEEIQRKCWPGVVRGYRQCEAGELRTTLGFDALMSRICGCSADDVDKASIQSVLEYKAQKGES